MGVANASGSSTLATLATLDPPMKQDSDPLLASLHKAIEAAGSQSRLADSLGLSFQHIQQWRRAGRVPAERVLSVEAAVNGAVTRYQLRPDVFGKAPAKATA